MHADVVVVGAGPAGSTAARELAARGVEVVMLDRARFPRDKPCGGAVTIRCAGRLPFSLDPVVEDVIHTARVRYRDGRDVAREAGRPITYMTQRCRLDAFLAEQARAAGADFRDGQRVTGVRQLPDATYEVDAGGEIYATRVVIGADGANGVVGTALGYEHAAESAVALEGNIPMPGGPPEEWRHAVALNFGYLPGGYGWVFPKGDHVNVGVGGWKGVVGTMLRPALERLCRVYGLGPGRARAAARPPPADATSRHGDGRLRLRRDRRCGRPRRSAVGRGHLRRHRQRPGGRSGGRELPRRARQFARAPTSTPSARSCCPISSRRRG